MESPGGISMMIRWIAALALCLLLSPPAARAEGDWQPQEGDVELHDFAFQNGEHLALLRLHYLTLGTPLRDAAGHITNAALLLHGTTGVARGFLQPTLADNLFRPGKPLDLAHNFIVIPDGIGVGGSTRPSEGLHQHFPHYGYIDQVEAQHALVAALGIEHLRLVSGISQGGMQTWLWGERFPTAMDALVPIATMPMQISGRNLMWRQAIIHAIRNDPDWQGGDYDPAHRPTAWMQVAAPIFALMVGNIGKLQESGPDRAQTLAYDDKLIEAYQTRDANDYLYDFESSADFDPAAEIGRIRAPMLAINFADDQVNPAQFSVAKDTIAKIHQARFTLLPGGFGHGSIFHAELWGPSLGHFMASLPPHRLESDDTMRAGHHPPG
jgi:homoserine O-acetyltransferase/O-succinyltransferase